MHRKSILLLLSISLVLINSCKKEDKIPEDALDYMGWKYTMTSARQEDGYQSGKGVVYTSGSARLEFPEFRKYEDGSIAGEIVSLPYEESENRAVISGFNMEVSNFRLQDGLLYIGETRFAVPAELGNGFIYFENIVLDSSGALIESGSFLKAETETNPEDVFELLISDAELADDKIGLEITVPLRKKANGNENRIIIGPGLVHPLKLSADKPLSEARDYSVELDFNESVVFSDKVRISGSGLDFQKNNLIFMNDTSIQVPDAEFTADNLVKTERSVFNDKYQYEIRGWDVDIISAEWTYSDIIFSAEYKSPPGFSAENIVLENLVLKKGAWVNDFGYREYYLDQIDVTDVFTASVYGCSINFGHLCIFNEYLMGTDAEITFPSGFNNFTMNAEDISFNSAGKFLFGKGSIHDSTFSGMEFKETYIDFSEAQITMNTKIIFSENFEIPYFRNRIFKCDFIIPAGESDRQVIMYLHSDTTDNKINFYRLSEYLRSINIKFIPVLLN